MEMAEIPTHVSQAEFGRLVGVSSMRISQLVRDGLIVVDDGRGVRLIESLRRYFGYQTYKKCGWTLSEYLRDVAED